MALQQRKTAADNRDVAAYTLAEAARYLRLPPATLRSWVLGREYPTADGSTPVTTATNLHIPLGRDVYFRLRSGDVIHSFWIPRLAGKTDVIPGRENHMWIKGTEIGTFDGQCAEFCGIGHAGMRLTVTVESEQDFQSWLKQQQAATRDGAAGQPALATTGSN
jgi:cytochrome c oxidase subunit 2